MTRRFFICVLLCGLCIILTGATKVKRDTGNTAKEPSTVQSQDNTEQPIQPTPADDIDDDEDDDDEDDDDVEDIDEKDKLMLEDTDDLDLDDDMNESQQSFNDLVDSHLKLRADTRKLKQSLGITGKKTGIKDVIDYLKDKYDDNFDFDVNDNNDRLTLTITSDNGGPLPADLQKANDDIQKLIEQSNAILDKAENAKKTITRITNNESKIVNGLTTPTSRTTARRNIVTLKDAQGMVGRLQSNIERYNHNIFDSVTGLINSAPISQATWTFCLVFAFTASGLFRQ